MNEFKVGDLVVRVDVDSPYLYAVQRIEKPLIMIIRKKKSNAVKVWATSLTDISIRHATPEEIKAGRRL